MYDTAATTYQHHSTAPVSRVDPGRFLVEDVGWACVVNERRARKVACRKFPGRIVRDEATFRGARAFPGGGGRLRRTIRRAVSRRVSGGVRHPRQPRRGGGLFAGSARTSAGEMEANARLRAGLGGSGIGEPRARSDAIGPGADRLAPLATPAASADRYDLAARRRDLAVAMSALPRRSARPWRCGTSPICPRPRPPARWVARWAR